METYLEDNMFFENVLDTINLVFSLALGKLSGCRAAIENGAVIGKFWHSGKLFGVGGRLFGSGRGHRCFCSHLRHRHPNGVQGSWP